MFDVSLAQPVMNVQDRKDTVSLKRIYYIQTLLVRPESRFQFTVFSAKLMKLSQEVIMFNVGTRYHQ